MVGKKLRSFILVFISFIILVGFASAAEICGDVNADGNIDDQDLQVVNGYLFEGGNIDNFFTADMNWDRFVNILDYSLLNNYLNGGSNPTGCDLMMGDGQDGCIQTNDFGDSQVEVLSHDHEITLEELLESRNYIIDVSGDQTQMQTFTTHNEIETEFRVLKMVAAYPAVFGYYTNGDVNSFVPLFESADHPDYNLPIIYNGDTFRAEFPENTEVAFAIDVLGSFNDSGFIYSENSLNNESKDHVLIYDASRQNTNSEFILAFEDTFQDWDYQDLVVVVKRTRCGPEQEPICGNNVREQGEQCDDGNNVDDDMCSNFCTINAYCGDGNMNQGWEECDDGNIASGDGCDAECYIEEEILCYDNADCGTNFYSGSFCSNDSVVKNYTSYVCNYPGQVNAYCSNSVEQVEIEECNYMCIEGMCQEQQNYCGDGIMQIGSGEQCDEGTQNGVKCDNDNNDCSYCSNQCLLVNLDEDDDGNGGNGISFLELSSFCSVNWKCTGWSECTNGIMTRTCEDANHCELIYNKPIEETSCTIKSAFVEEEKPNNYYGLWLILAILLIALITLAVNWNEF